jgi:hypothetical protein
MATSTMGIKCKPLSISEKLNIISKVDGTPNAPCTKTAEEPGIPVTTLHTAMYNRNKILKQSLTELNKKKIKTAKCEEVEAILMERFRQKRALNLTVDGPILKRKAEEMATKLNIEFRPSSGWIDRFKKTFWSCVQKSLC